MPAYSMYSTDLPAAFNSGTMIFRSQKPHRVIEYLLPDRAVVGPPPEAVRHAGILNVFHRFASRFQFGNDDLLVEDLQRVKVAMHDQHGAMDLSDLGPRKLLQLRCV